MYLRPGRNATAAAGHPMKLASWNVNSVRVRLERILAFLEREAPDVLCLQELKATEENFPSARFREAGYHSVCHGQKTYNGVAILTRGEPAAPLSGLDDEVDDPQARLLGCDFGGIRVLSAYVPNGHAVGTDKWEYKLAWLSRLRRYLERRHDPARPLALSGDFNVATDERDVHDPKLWEETVLFHPEIRAALAELTRWGLVDTFRLHNQEAGHFSWWDYRAGAFHRNWGVRIDYVFASRGLAGRCSGASIDRDERKGEQPSDHAPVLATFSDP